MLDPMFKNPNFPAFMNDMSIYDRLEQIGEILARGVFLSLKQEAERKMQEGQGHIPAEQGSERPFKGADLLIRNGKPRRNNFIDRIRELE